MDKAAESDKVSQKSDEHKTRGRHEEELVREQEAQQKEGLDQELNVLKKKLSRLKNGKKKLNGNRDSPHLLLLSLHNLREIPSHGFNPNLTHYICRHKERTGGG